ncbi:MAG: RluA family pseudouridine synthase [Candidatus Berkiellales bacterium]
MLANHHQRKEVQHLIVTPSNAGQRIDNFLLSQLPGVPRSRVYRIIRKGEVRVNKGRIDVSYRLINGDSVRIPPLVYMPKSTESSPVSEKFSKMLEQAILYEDDKLLVIDKPAGLAVHGGSGISLGLIEALRRTRPKEPFLELVHRLDRDTSGCVMIAKRRSMLLHLHESLKLGKIKKTYFALVEGCWQAGTMVEVPLLRYVLKSGERMVKVDPTGKPAKTSIKILESFPNATLLQASPLTGRTHQIRVHCAYKGHPIVGDQKYGSENTNRQAKQEGCDRLFLHAYQLIINLPYQPYTLSVVSPLKQDCEKYLSYLKKPEESESHA